MTPVEMVASLQRAKAYTAEARENTMRIGMRWSLEDAEREIEAVLAALQAAPADSTAATWHVGQMALYRRLEALAKDDEWRGVHRDDGLVAEMRFKADMHERAARALSRPGPEPATPEALTDWRCGGCDHRWAERHGRGAMLCGDCWRKVQPHLHGAAPETPK